MNLVTLQNKIKEIRVQIANKLGVLALIDGMPSLKTEAEQTIQVIEINALNDRVMLLTRAFDAQINLATRLNTQFCAELADSIRRELLLQFKLLADQEKKQTWWFGWLRSRPIQKQLSDFESTYTKLNKINAVTMKDHIQAFAEALASHGESDSILKTDVNELLNIAFPDQPNRNDLVQELRTKVDDSLLEARLNNVCSNLLEVTEKKERGLEAQFKAQYDIPEQELTLGFYNIPGYENMSEEHRRIYENLYLQAKCPTFRHESKRQDEGETLSRASSLSAFSEWPDEAKEKQLVDVQDSHENDDAEIVVPMNFLQEIAAPINNLKNRGLSIWGFSEPSEAKTVKRLEAMATKNEAVTMDELVAAKRRINRLREHSKFDTKDLDDLERAFDSAYAKSEKQRMSDCFIRNKAQRMAERFQKDRVEALQNYEQLLKKTTTSSDRVIQEIHFPHQLSDLQALIYFIFAQQSSDASVDLPPVTWTYEDGLRMRASTGNYASLLNTINDLHIEDVNSSVYFVVLVLSIKLIQLGRDSSDYSLLQRLLSAVFSGQYNDIIADTKRSLANNMPWLMNYLPDTLPDTLKKIEGQPLKKIEPLLIGQSSQLFPPQQARTPSQDNSRRSVSAASASPMRSSMFSMSGKSSDLDLITPKERFLKLVEAKAKYIMTKPCDHGWVRTESTVTADFSRWNAAGVSDNIILVYTLLRLYVTKRNVPNSEYLTDGKKYFGLKESIPICQDLMERLEDYCNGTDSACSLSLTPLTSLALKFPTGKKLINVMKETFPLETINFSVSETLSSDSEEESLPDSSEDFDEAAYIGNLCKWTKEIHSNSDQQKIQGYIATNVAHYPQANKVVLAAYILWKHFKEMKSFEKLSKELKTKYEITLARLFRAVTTKEQVVPAEMAQFMHETSTVNNNELEMLFARTSSLFGANDEMVSPVKARQKNSSGENESGSHPFPAIQVASDDEDGMLQHSSDSQASDGFLKSAASMFQTSERRGAYTRIEERGGVEAEGQRRESSENLLKNYPSPESSIKAMRSESSQSLFSSLFSSPVKKLPASMTDDELINHYVSRSLKVGREISGNSILTEIQFDVGGMTKNFLQKLLNKQQGVLQRLPSAMSLYCVLNWYCAMNYPENKAVEAVCGALGLERELENTGIVRAHELIFRKLLDNKSVEPKFRALCNVIESYAASWDADLTASPAAVCAKKR